MEFQIDLNCDMGEGFGTYKLGNDEEILNYVTSANVACGFHAGDPTTMRKTVKLAMEKGVGIGAHPGFQDLLGFGRRSIAVTPQEAYDIVVYQIGALDGFIRAEGGQMQHVKPHGALYNQSARDKQLAEAIAEAVYAVNPELILFGLSGSELVKAGRNVGLRTAEEVFADRTYQADGSLSNRREGNALIEQKDIAIQQAVRMVKEGVVVSIDGSSVPIAAHTICIHGDGSNALQFARSISEELSVSGITLKKISEFL